MEDILKPSILNGNNAEYPTKKIHMKDFVVHENKEDEEHENDQEQAISKHNMKNTKEKRR